MLYNLDEKEGLEYIENRFGKAISPRTYYMRKKNLQVSNNSVEWAEYYTRVGLMVSFHELMDSAQKQYKDTMHQLYIEQQKENRNESLILKLKADLREQGVYILRLGDTTPVILQLRKLLSDKSQYHY